MDKDAQHHLIHILDKNIHPLTDNYSSLLDEIGDKRFVMIGEATHGTYEFYQTRIEITQRLIKEKGFMAVAIEGDWPSAYGIHRFIKGKGNRTDWENALQDFNRFPIWMWRNSTIPPFIQWLRRHNDSINSAREKIGFYGLDIYSLQSSTHAVIDYLMNVDPDAAERAKSRYACFDHINIDPQLYGYLTNLGIKKSCIDEAITVLVELQHNAFEYLGRDGITAEDEYFFATQNARVVKDAEIYYRSMFEGHVSSWNVRDHHMAETLNTLAAHLENNFKKPAKIVIWAHNSHVGDARATEMSERGEINIGQLLREQYDQHVYSIGFSTYDGYVTAASDWDQPAERKKINPGLQGSYEDLFHQLRSNNFILFLNHNLSLEHYLKIPRLQRAIGVIYRPETERMSHYFFTHLTYQFDCIIHFDNTNEVEPLEVITV